MSEREREHHAFDNDPTTARLQRGTEVPPGEHAFEDVVCTYVREAHSTAIREPE